VYLFEILPVVPFAFICTVSATRLRLDNDGKLPNVSHRPQKKTASSEWLSIFDKFDHNDTKNSHHTPMLTIRTYVSSQKTSL